MVASNGSANNEDGSGDIWNTMVVNESVEGAKLDLSGSSPTAIREQPTKQETDTDMWSTMVVRDDVEGASLSAITSTNEKDAGEEDEGGGDMWSTMVVKENAPSEKLNIGDTPFSLSISSLLPE